MPAAPNFFIVGAPKSGTTALWRFLAQEDRARVIEIYEGSVRELAALVQRELSPWLDPCRSFARDSASSR